jgi:hypothetical protein
MLLFGEAAGSGNSQFGTLHGDMKGARCEE